MEQPRGLVAGAVRETATPVPLRTHVSHNSLQTAPIPLLADPANANPFAHEASDTRP